MQAQKYSIKDWAEDDRPREKLLSKSPSALSDSELLAILIRDGVRSKKGNQGKTAVDLAREIFSLGKNNLDELGRLSVGHLMKVKGIGQAKAITIAAALELGRRRHATPFLEKTQVQNSRATAAYLQALLKDHNREMLGVLFLNRANKVNHFEILSEGGITSTIADSRVIIQKALEFNAVSIIICHNHPSGSLRPSRDDKDFTYKIQLAAQCFDIKVMDHVIVSNEGFYSFADNGLI